MSFGYENTGLYSTGMIGGWHETLANEAIAEEAWRKEFEPSWFSKLLSNLRNRFKKCGGKKLLIRHKPKQND